MIDNLVSRFHELVGAIPVEKIGVGIIIAVVAYGIYAFITDL